MFKKNAKVLSIVEKVTMAQDKCFKRILIVSDSLEVSRDRSWLLMIAAATT